MEQAHLQSVLVSTHDEIILPEAGVQERDKDAPTQPTYSS
jgi:hypothetical protein